ncbi:MAG: hypothetical protein RLZ24_615, partial [Actinomycetota bacterium]
MALTALELTQLWERVVDHVSTGEPQHRAFLAMTKPRGLVENEDGPTSLLVAAPNAFAKDVLESRLRPVVNEVLTRELGSAANIAVMVDDSLELADLPEPTISVEVPRPGTGREAAPTISSSSSGDVLGSQLNERYTFETFVTGESNRFARAAAIAVAEAPAKAYNPLFIYGDSGLGKTHLLHAIGAYSRELFPNIRVRYVSSEEFTNDFINSIRDDKATSFQRRYRDLDVLLIDDIQ